MQLLATEPQKVAMKAFADWKKTITLDMLKHEAVAMMLEEVAKKQADNEEAAAGKAATLKWASWMHEGPAAGLGRQHKMSKVAQGWAPTAIAKGRADDMPSLEEEDIDDEDGLSLEGLQEAIAARGEGGGPASTQQEADQEALDWGVSGWQTPPTTSRSGRMTSQMG